MAKPTAARGKVTRKEKRKRIFEKIKENKPKKIETNLNMSPGAMGGRTERQLPTPPRLRSGTPMPTLSKKIFDELDAIKTKADEASKKLFKDGGEVMDLTTEVDVE